MLNRILACLLLAFIAATPVAFSTPARADDASHLKAAQDLLASTDMNAMLQQSLDRILAVQIQAMPQLAPYKDTLRAFLTKYMSWDAMKDDITKLYVDNFTEEELKDITAFYQTPTGKKALAVMPELMSKGAQLGQQRVQQHMPELQQMIADAVKAKKAQEQQSAPAPAPAAPAEPAKP